MADRSVKVTLRANVQDFKNQIGQAATSLDQLAQKGDKTGAASQTLMGRVTQSMQLQREQWQTAGVALAGFGTAITGVGVAALNTGISYNTLQQTSRAALQTLTGSAEEANRQMDKLDEFASTSPFAKDVFIRAQQQMLGFGIEAQKVIPFLDSIQQSVAATGGSNHDIAELSRIFSQISASAKITATDLREFGNRGIDAATLIGSQMGMTGAQIRESITAGTLDAGEALDALAAGMQATYGGAADNVKNTITGAFDRVKAAWRDLSGDLAAPLVGPEGGGLLVGLLNTTADLMRGFQNLPEPIKVTAGALGGLAGVGSLTAGAFLLLAPRVMDSVIAFRALRDLNLLQMAGGLSGVAGSVVKFALPVAAFAGVLALHEALNGISEGDYGDVDALASALTDVADGGTTASDALTQLGTVAGTKGLFTRELEDMSDLVENLGPLFDKAFGQSGWNKLERVLDAPGDPVGKANEKIRALDESLAAMVSSGNADQAADAYSQIAGALEESGVSAEEAAGKFGGYHDALAEFFASGGELKGIAEGWQAIREQIGGAPMQLPDGSTVWDFADATGEAADETSRLAGVSEEARVAAEELGISEEALAGILESQIGSIRDLIDARRGLRGESASLVDAESAHRDAVEGLTGALEDQSVAFDTATGRFDGYTEAGEKASKASEDYRDAMWDMAEAMYDQGASQDEVIARLQTMRDEYEQQVSGLQGVGDKAGEVADQYRLFPEEIATSFDLDAASALDTLAVVEDRLVEFDGRTLTVNGDTTPLSDTVAGTLGLIADQNGMVTIDGNTHPADMTWQTFLEIIRLANPEANIGADDAGARRILDALRHDVDVAYDEVNVGADTSQARGDVDRELANTRGKSTTVNVGANLTPFNNALGGILGRAVGNATVNITARYAGGAFGLATGGYVSGPGTATSDSIPAWLSNGEYVIKAASVAKYGVDFFNRLNAGRYAQGGYVSARSASAPVVNVNAPANFPSQLGLSIDGKSFTATVTAISDARIDASQRRSRIVGRRP